MRSGVPLVWRVGVRYLCELSMSADVYVCMHAHTAERLVSCSSVRCAVFFYSVQLVFSVITCWLSGSFLMQ